MRHCAICGRPLFLEGIFMGGGRYVHTLCWYRRKKRPIASRAFSRSKGLAARN